MPEESFGGLGRLLILVGIGLVVLGGLLVVLGRTPGLGALPGDFRWERGGTRLYVPLGTMLVVSIVLTILVNVILRLFR